jgi:regulator of ribonuclease activity A
MARHNAQRSFHRETPMNFATADLCDAHEDQLAADTLRVVEPVFSRFGRASCFGGEAVTLKVFEDNTLVRATLEEKGAGRVRVIDGGGSLRCAQVGGNLGKLGEKNGWAWGRRVRLRARHAGIERVQSRHRRLATHPQRSQKRGRAERDVPVHLPDTIVRPGEWLYADVDGVLVASASLP